MNLCNGLLEIWITTSRVTAHGDNGEFAFRWAFLEMDSLARSGSIWMTNEKYEHEQDSRIKSNYVSAQYET